VDRSVHDVLILIIKGLAGGSLVVTFALVSEVVSPKRFAGLFSAAPSVALAGLVVTLLDKGPHDARENSLGMLAGCAGMVAYAAAAVFLLRRGRTWLGVLGALGAWAVVAVAVAVPVVMD
jgi:uncharacterized membrane protein (GlpM family)